MNREYYTWEELREMGCPDGLIIQYVFFTKEENKRLFRISKELLDKPEETE